VSDMEYSRVKREARADEVLSYREALARHKKGGKDGSTILNIFVFVSQWKKIRCFEVPSTFPVGLADELRDHGLMVHSKQDPFFPERCIKTEQEAGWIRASLRAAEAGMREAVTALKESRVERKKGGELRLGGERLTSGRLRSLIQKTILDKGCHAMHTITAGGPQGYDPHERGEGPLRAGQPIIIDIFPRSEASGYYGDMTRTLLKGKATERVRSMFRAVKMAQDYAVSQVRPGAQGQRIHQWIVDLFTREGFPTREKKGRTEGFLHGTGHGLGLDIHEYPWISSRPCRLRMGNVVTVEPGLYYPDIGGIRLEDVVWVTKEGARRLTRFPRFLEIA